MEIKRNGDGLMRTYIISSGNRADNLWPKEILYLMGAGELDDDRIADLALNGLCKGDGTLSKTGVQAAKFLKENLIIVDGAIYDRKTLLPFMSGGSTMKVSIHAGR